MAILERSPFIFPDVLFHTEEDRHAWEYYVRLVSSNVPALDGPDNPYRQLSFTALTSPILLETIVCIATEHMLNFGLGTVSTAAQRQQQMLRTIGHSLHGIDATGIHMTGSAANNIDHEALLTAVVLQGWWWPSRPTAS
ncbi:uncharacterized protein N7477_009427 [Penicillium maclennaniae]|uniref:uncharacterized protein n=1 Tax=Penicillium maclennaniae TaxID=1343394 RepID=UPI00253FE71E|nr:uncharacterized protein N7477_009427 [Penicillium maclennaniae]KAJ5661811.1 hypothetical protein N7477_009427 [Penicillium maclennaniae]